MSFRVYTKFKALPNEAKGCVLAIGNFDGVHRGHQKLLSIAREHADALRVPAGVLTFEPHPRWFFNPCQKPFRLSSKAHKAEYIADHAIDQMMVATFDADLANMSAKDFVETLLVQDLNVSHVVVGADYRFGKKRQGDVSLLKTYGKEFGFGVTEVPPYKDAHGLTCSSTRVREALSEGQTELVEHILGRKWELMGKVQAVQGHAVSVALKDFIRPSPGTYNVLVKVMNNRGTEVIEHHETTAWISAFDLSGDDDLHIVLATPNVLGKVLRVEFIEYIGLSGPYPARHIAQPAVNIW